MTDHEVVSRERWQAASEELLRREKEHTRIPWVSAANTDFNLDLGASHTPEQVRAWSPDEGTLPPIAALNAAATGTDVPGQGDGFRTWIRRHDEYAGL